MWQNDKKKSSAPESIKLRGWILVYSTRDMRSSKFVPMIIPVWPLTFIFLKTIHYFDWLLCSAWHLQIFKDWFTQVSESWPLGFLFFSIIIYPVGLGKRSIQVKYFLVLHKNVLCCGYSLEVPLWGASNDYHNLCLCVEMIKKKKILTLILLNPDIPCLCKQCKSRSSLFEEANWSGFALFLIYSAWQGLIPLAKQIII